VYIENIDDNSLNIYLSGPDNTQYIGQLLGETLEKRSIVELNGHLGAGKTVLVKGIAKGLGLDEEPNSPSFVILNTYEGKLSLHHFDLYRLSKIEELEDINYLDYFYNEGVTVVEWAENIPDAFPYNTIKVNISLPMENSDETDRIITIKGEKKWLLSFRNTVEQALQTLKR
jgi:tRNA threonylcarbamoyladenosine biosynthesis protein TsaE